MHSSISRDDLQILLHEADIAARRLVLGVGVPAGLRQIVAVGAGQRGALGAERIGEGVPPVGDLVGPLAPVPVPVGGRIEDLASRLDRDADRMQTAIRTGTSVQGLQ